MLNLTLAQNKKIPNVASSFTVDQKSHFILNKNKACVPSAKQF
jgi:hypothetical protein